MNGFGSFNEKVYPFDENSFKKYLKRLEKNPSKSELVNSLLISLVKNEKGIYLEEIIGGDANKTIKLHYHILTDLTRNGVIEKSISSKKPVSQYRKKDNLVTTLTWESRNFVSKYVSKLSEN